VVLVHYYSDTILVTGSIEVWLVSLAYCRYPIKPNFRKIMWNW